MRLRLFPRFQSAPGLAGGSIQLKNLKFFKKLGELLDVIAAVFLIIEVDRVQFRC